MSKLLERLQRASEGGAQPLGFNAAARQRVPALALIAHLPRPSEELAANAAGNGAEFILVSAGQRGALPNPLPPQGTGEAPWGVRIPTLTEAQHAALKEAGCDFALISVEETPVRLLSDEAIGIVAGVPATTEDRWLRAVGQLPLDAVLVEAEPAPELTLKQLLDYTVVASRVSQYLLAPASLQWGQGEIEQVRDMGFCGLVVDVASADDLEGLKALRDTVLALPARRRRKEERLRARVPQVGASAAHQHEVEDPDDDDDDYDDDY